MAGVSQRISSAIVPAPARETTTVAFGQCRSSAGAAEMTLGGGLADHSSLGGRIETSPNGAGVVQVRFELSRCTPGRIESRTQA